MADDEQSAEEAGKQAPTRPARYGELVADRENLKKVLGRHVAETEERQSQLLAAVREPAEEIKAAVATIHAESDADRLQRKELSGAINGLVAFLGDNARTGAATAGPRNGAQAGAEGAADTVGDATSDDGAVEAEGAAGEEESGTATAGEQMPAAARENGDDGEGAAGEDAGSAATAGREEPAAAGSDTATAEDSTATGGEESATGGDGPAPAAEGDVPQDAAAAIARALAKLLPLDDVRTSIEAIREAIARGGEADEAKTGPGIDTVIDVLSAVRGDLDAQAELIQALHRNPPPGEGQATLSADHAVKLHDELMKHMDYLIVRIAPAVSGEAKKDEKEQKQDAAALQSGRQDRPPPTGLDEVRTAAADLSTQLRAEGSAFRRFAWVFAIAVIPMAAALGIVAQREFGIMPALPEIDPTGGWKDIVWEDYGEEISHCRGMENAGGGACVVTVTPPGR